MASDQSCPVKRDRALPSTKKKPWFPWHEFLSCEALDEGQSQLCQTKPNLIWATHQLQKGPRKAPFQNPWPWLPQKVFQVPSSWTVSVTRVSCPAFIPLEFGRSDGLSAHHQLERFSEKTFLCLTRDVTWPPAHVPNYHCEILREKQNRICKSGDQQHVSLSPFPSETRSLTSVQITNKLHGHIWKKAQKCWSTDFIELAFHCKIASTPKKPSSSARHPSLLHIFSNFFYFSSSTTPSLSTSSTASKKNLKNLKTNQRATSNLPLIPSCAQI